MSIYGNGFLAYHFEVLVGNGQVALIKSHVESWKETFKQTGTWTGFPDTLVDRLRALPGVESVVCEGPQSSVLIPLRMARGLTGLPVTLSTVLGTGPITYAVEDCLDEWGVGCEPARRLTDADMPLEFSFRDAGGGQHASQLLYPASRTRYRAAITAPQLPPDHLVLNRFNQGLWELARAVAGRGGIVSFRPRDLGRHDRMEDYLSLFPLTRQLVLSSRHGILRQFARQAGLAVPRGWPEGAAAFTDPTGRRLAAWLFERLPSDAILAFNHYPTCGSVFYRRIGEPVAVPAPAGYDTASRAARLQGAMLGVALGAEHEGISVADSGTWSQVCIRFVDIAFVGTDVRPWRYPS